MSNKFTDMPSEMEFLAAFGVDPIESVPQDGFWCYLFEEEDVGAIRFSFNTHDRSVQTVWESNGRAVCTVVHENADRIAINDKGGETGIFVDFVHERDACRTRLELRVHPHLEITWSSLRRC